MGDLGIILILLAHLAVFIWMQYRIERDLGEALGRRRGWLGFGFGRGAITALAAVNRARSLPVEECPLCHRRKAVGMSRCSCGAPYANVTDPGIVADLRKRCADGQKKDQARMTRK